MGEQLIPRSPKTARGRAGVNPGGLMGEEELDPSVSKDLLLEEVTDLLGEELRQRLTL